MDIVEATIRLLLTDGTVNGIVAGRIRPLLFDQSQDWPAIRVTQVSGPREMHLTGASGVAMPRVQIDCCAETYAATKALAAAVRQRLNGFRGLATDGDSPVVDSLQILSCTLADEIDMFDDEVRVRRTALDFLFSCRE